jgi:hypothetical protein
MLRTTQEWFQREFTTKIFKTTGRLEKFQHITKHRFSFSFGFEAQTV